MSKMSVRDSYVVYVVISTAFVLLAHLTVAEAAKEDGIQKEYDAEYQSELVCEYRNDQKNGWCRGQTAGLPIEIYYENGKKIMQKTYSQEREQLIERKRWGYWENYGYENGGIRWEHILLDGEETIPSVVRTFHENGQLASQRIYKLVGRHGSLVSQKYFDKRGKLICEKGGPCDIEQLKKNKNFYAMGCEKECVETADELVCRCYTIEGKLVAESSFKNGREATTSFDPDSGVVTFTRQYQDGKIISENGSPRP